MIGSSYNDPDISEQSDFLRKIDNLKDQLKQSVPVKEIRYMLDEWKEQVNKFDESTMTGDDCIFDVENLIKHYE